MVLEGPFVAWNLEQLSSPRLWVWRALVFEARFRQMVGSYWWWVNRNTPRAGPHRTGSAIMMIGIFIHVRPVRLVGPFLGQERWESRSGTIFRLHQKGSGSSSNHTTLNVEWFFCIILTIQWSSQFFWARCVGFGSIKRFYHPSTCCFQSAQMTEML